jgi:hemerythrin-like metal-binding protein
MDLIVWGPKYELGHETVDFQHKNLVQILNNLNTAIEKNQALLLVEITLDELVKYTKYHFQDEEDLFSKSEYPGVDGHKNSHKSFIEEVASFQKRFEMGDDRVAVDIVGFLRDWLINHILVDDKAYIEYLK